MPADAKKGSRPASSRAAIARPTTSGNTVTVAALCRGRERGDVRTFGRRPRFWYCGLLAPLPLLATAVELPTCAARSSRSSPTLSATSPRGAARVSQFRLLTAVRVAMSLEQSCSRFSSHCAIEATRRWSGILAALVFPTFETAFYFSLAQQSPHGTWGSPAYSQVDFFADATDCVVAGNVRRSVHSCRAAVGTRAHGIAADGTWTGRIRRLWRSGFFAFAIILGIVSVLLAPKTPVGAS